MLTTPDDIYTVYVLQQMDRKVLDIEDFRVVDVLGDKGLILVCPRQERSSKEDLHEDASLPMHAVELDSVGVSEHFTGRLNSDDDNFLLKLENPPFQFLEVLCQDQHLSEGMANQNSHMICETEYIFVEQISLALK